LLFITPATSTKHAKDYYTQHMARSDYYMKDSPEIAGEWHGLGAELLGLQGTVDKERYFALCDNLNPTTLEHLTPHTKGNRRILYDFTFDAPKSVTLAYELGGDDRIMDEFRAAVKDTMSEMEAAMMTRVRRGKRDEDRATSNMVWGEFIHRTTRPLEDGTPDPQLHCHATVFNTTFDTVENKWKAAQFGNIVRYKGYYQAAFHSRLAERLSAIGYGTERDGNSFRLTGIAPATTEKFSRRTDVIEEEAKRLGITNAKAKGELGARTRQKKDPETLPVSELRKLWSARLSDDEREGLLKAKESVGESTSLDAARAMDYALAHCFERESALPEKELLKTALIHSVGNASVADIRGELSRDNILRRERSGVRYATTKEVLQEEIAMSNFAREGRGRHVKLGGIKPPELDAELSKEQRDAAQTILGSRDTVTALKGGAGTGKTRMMQATVRAIESTGKQVFTFAPSAEASRGVLRSEGFENAETVESLLIDPKKQAAVRGQVLWVDEAGLLSARDMKRLFDVAKDQNARIVLSGDTSQHNAVFRGDALRILEKDAGLKTAELKEIRRQTNDDYRSAVKAISEGDAPGKHGKTRLEEGIDILDGMGAIIDASGEDRYRKIAADYAEVTSTRKHDGKLKTALVVSPTHAEAGHVTDAIRDRLKDAGRIGNDERQFTALRPLNLTEAQRTEKEEYSVGAVVQFHQNARGFTRGDRVTVTGTDKEGVHVKRADGSSTLLPLKESAKFQLYAPQSVALAKGDKLRITQNGFTRETRRGLSGMVTGKKAKDRLNNGAVYDVDGFTREGDIKLGNGFVVPKDYGGISHGYVVTSHASQGKTVDVSLIALGQESFAAANKEQFYVSASRGREAVRLYTDDKAAMMDAVQSSAARLSATELMQPVPQKRKPFFTERMVRLGSVIQPAYSAMRDRIAARMQSIHRPQREGLSLG
jgi:conjugative relaxase-like TrwC/TraI family protein